VKDSPSASSQKRRHLSPNRWEDIVRRQIDDEEYGLLEPPVQGWFSNDWVIDGPAQQPPRTSEKHQRRP